MITTLELIVCISSGLAMSVLAIGVFVVVVAFT